MFSALARNAGNMQYKINNFIALGPVVSLAHTSDKFYQALTKTSRTLRDIELNLGHIYVVGAGKKWKKQEGKFCRYMVRFSHDICYGKHGILTSFESANTYKGKHRKGNPHEAKNGASMKSLVHLGQLGQSEKFQEYSYALTGNLMHYHSRDPPLIPLRKISRTNIFLVAGTDD